MVILLNSRPFRIAIWILLIFLIILVGRQISGVFEPLRIVFRALFYPLIISGLLYYWLYPIVDRVARTRLPRWLAILLLYIAIGGLIAILAIVIGPLLQRQFISLINNSPRFVDALRIQLISIQDNEWVARFQQGGPLTFEDLVDQLTAFANQFVVRLTVNIPNILGVTANVLTTVFIIPFILFYMLLEGHKLPDAIVSFLPKRHRTEARQVIKDMDGALSSYIQGVIIISLSVAALAFVGYSIIGLDYALLLALVAGITNVIPFFGPIIGTLPGVFVALTYSPGMVWKVLIMILVIQQIESILLSPRVMGRKISTHPVLIILIVIAAGKLAGFLGILLAIPAYAVARVVVSHLYSLFRIYADSDG